MFPNSNVLYLTFYSTDILPLARFVAIDSDEYSCSSSPLQKADFMGL